MPEQQWVTEEQWFNLGVTDGGLMWDDDQGEMVPYAPSPALSRPHGPAHRYPAPRSTRTNDLVTVARRVRGDEPAGEPLWTIGDALEFLDPRPNRRTLSRWLRKLESPGTRALPQGGPPARLYRAREIMHLHASWAADISV